VRLTVDRTLLRVTILFLLLAPAAEASTAGDSRGLQPQGRVTAADPCFAPLAGTGRTRRPQWRAHLTRDVAVYVIKHVQLACRQSNAFVAEQHDLLQQRGGLADATLFAENLRTHVLEPIYRAYPDLRGKDLTPGTTGEERIAGALSGHGPPPQWMGRRTALRLRGLLNEAQQQFSRATAKLSAPVGSDKIDALDQQLLDMVAEVSFAASPIYRSFPDLWKAQSIRAWHLANTSAPASDAKPPGIPPPGTVHLTESALSYARRFITAVRQQVGEEPIAAISWDNESAWKGPQDADWHKLGPGLSLGAFARRQVPADAIETIDGLKFVFYAPDPAIFVGKMIDFADGKFQLRDQAPGDRP